MNRRNTTALLAVMIFLVTLPSQAQQTAQSIHRYLVKAVLTIEGIKNLQKQPPTALRAGVQKFVQSRGGKLESWYFDYADTTAFAIIAFPDEISAATAQLSTNSNGFARVTLRPLITAEDADRAVAKIASGARSPQQP